MIGHKPTTGGKHLSFVELRSGTRFRLSIMLLSLLLISVGVQYVTSKDIKVQVFADLPPRY